MCNCKKPCSNSNSSCYEAHAPKQLDCFEPCSTELMDAKDIRYKTMPDEVSQLLNLDIQKGESLEYILELYGRMFYNIKYIEAPKVRNFEELNTYEKIIQYLFQKNDELNLALEQLEEVNADLQEQINSIKEDIEKLKYPEVTDDSNLGFIQGDSLETILQLIINNQTL